MSWMADLEYRINIVTRIFAELFWYLMQLSVFEVLYTHAKTISGWDVNGMRVFMGCLFVTDVFYMILLSDNMDQFWSLAKKGDLDLYLTKPVNSQFMLSFRKVSVTYFPNLLLCGGYLIWAASRLEQSITYLQLALFPVLLISAILISYSLRFMFVTIVVALQDAGSIQFVWHQLHRLATRPDSLYPSPLRIIVFTVFPVAFFASVPSRLLVEGIDPVLLVAAPALGFGTLWLSHIFWEKALSYYSSASS